MRGESDVVVLFFCTVVVAALAPSGSPMGGIQRGQEQHPRHGTQCSSVQLQRVSWQSMIWMLAPFIQTRDLQCHPLLTLKSVWFNSLLLSPQYVSPLLFGLISRPLFVFLINDHSTGITVRRTFGTDSHLSTDTQQNSHSSVSFKYTKKVTESGDIVRRLTFCVGGGSDSESSPGSFSNQGKSQRGERAMPWCAVTSCSAVLHFTGYRQQICKDASCFHNAFYSVMLLSAGKLISPLLLYSYFFPPSNVFKLCLYLV